MKVSDKELKSLINKKADVRELKHGDYVRINNSRGMSNDRRKDSGVVLRVLSVADYVVTDYSPSGFKVWEFDWVKPATRDEYISYQESFIEREVFADEESGDIFD